MFTFLIVCLTISNVFGASVNSNFKQDSKIFCSNNGVGYSDGKGNFFCKCKPNTAGKQCSIVLPSNPATTPCSNPCATNNPCVHGNCFNNNGQSVCQCFNGFFGANCQYMITAPTTPCTTTAATAAATTPCSTTGATTPCSTTTTTTPCSTTTTTTPCSTLSTNPASSTNPNGSTTSGTNNNACNISPCQNAGTCISDSNGIPSCSCPPLWTGTYCQYSVAPK